MARLTAGWTRSIAARRLAILSLEAAATAAAGGCFACRDFPPQYSVIGEVKDAAGEPVTNVDFDLRIENKNGDPIFVGAERSDGAGVFWGAIEVPGSCCALFACLIPVEGTRSLPDPTVLVLQRHGSQQGVSIQVMPEMIVPSSEGFMGTLELGVLTLALPAE